MQRLSSEFQLNLQMIPVLNARMEFNNHVNTLGDPGFREQLTGPKEFVRTLYQDWYGLPEVLITGMLQRILLGLEGYVSAAVRISLQRAGKLPDPLPSFLTNPFTLGGKGTANTYFNRLPAKLNPEFALAQRNQVLWVRTKVLYDEVRNPLFHGFQLERADVDGANRVCAHVAELYDWVDAWFDMEKIIPGASQLSHRRGSRRADV